MDVEIKDRFRPGDFPLMIVDVAAQSQTGKHKHRFEELVICWSGHGSHSVGNVEHRIGTGSVFVVDQERDHGYWDTEGLALSNLLYLPDELLIPWADLRTLPGYHVLFSLEPRYRQQHEFRSRLYLAPPALAQIKELVDQLRSEIMGCPPGYRFTATALFMQIISFLVRSYDVEEGSPTAGLLRIAETMAHLEEHFSEDTTLDQLARISMMSKRNFQRVFLNTVGSSPITYLINLRMTRAKDFLSQTRISIGEVAEACGYHNTSFFVRQFREKVGMTPNAYRRSIASS